MVAKSSVASRVASRKSSVERKSVKRPAKRIRRVGGETSKTRSDLLDAAEELMRHEGYAAVTSRRVAKQAKLTPQLVHYYFRTMDDLFLALWRRFVENNVQRHARAFDSAEPLRSLWNFSRNNADAVLETEFMSLAHHRKAIRKELNEDGDRFRQMQVDALAHGIKRYAFPDDDCSAEIVTVLLTNLARSIVMEKSFGMSSGHTATFRYVEAWIDKLERRAQRNSRGRALAARVATTA